MTPELTKQRTSDAVHVAKCIATLSIVFAHIPFFGVGVYADTVLARFGSIGVILFFLCSAYYFSAGKDGFFAFAKKKGGSIVLPWVVTGVIVYVIYHIQSGLSPYGLFRWVIGHGSYLWYLPILLCIFALFYRFSQNTVFLCSCVVVSVVSLLLTSFGVLDPVIQTLHLTNYLFLPNWVGVFAIGCLMRKYDLLVKILDLKWIYVAIVAVGYIGLLILAAYLEPGESGYFSKFGLLLELIGAFLVLFLAGKVPVKPIVKLFSGCSFAIYLFHFVGILILKNITEWLGLTATWLPVFYFIPVTLLVFGVLFVGDILAKKCKLEKFYRLLTGIRMPK